jgi:soluble lytic murein transglycosylase
MTTKSVYECVMPKGWLLHSAAAVLSAALVTMTPGSAQAQGGDEFIVAAREAVRSKNLNNLTSARVAASASGHPLAMWPEYWELSSTMAQARQEQVSAFSARWAGTYVEDRLRNDWLLELGKRQDWPNFAAEFPRFRMNDDREVSCYALLVDHLGGKDVREAARTAWMNQREADDGCHLLAATLYAGQHLTAADAWRKARFAIDANRPRSARQAAALVSPAAASAVAELTDNPGRFLRTAQATPGQGAELTTLALMRWASNDSSAASAQLAERWDRVLPPELSAWAWAAVGKQAALKLQPAAANDFERAAQRSEKTSRGIDWTDDLLAWKARAALRADNGKPRWAQVLQAIGAMSAQEQRDGAWVYWKARAMLALAGEASETEAMRGVGRELLKSIASQLGFYPGLAAEYLSQTVFMPARPNPLTAAERSAAAQTPGLVRGLQLMALGLRSEGEREWNFTLREMTDRELLAAAQLACDREVYKSCINTSERTRTEIDMTQRFPMPFLREVTQHARAIDLDVAYVYGLIRQESRFLMDARSSVGASGLMQLMPATARWTAKKIGLPYSAELITDRNTNLKLGTTYLKLALDDFGGSQALAAAAYNAGPNRPRKWREGSTLEAAVWAENIPFAETRDYVKKVISNGSYYAALLNGQAPTLKNRLGSLISPAPLSAVENKDLP